MRRKGEGMTTAVKVMTTLAMLSEVEKSLRFLTAVGVVKEESIVKGCRKFVKDHPEIQSWIDSNAFADDEGSNVMRTPSGASTELYTKEKMK